MDRSAAPTQSGLTARPAPDFRLLFESVPGLYLAVAPDLTIVAASDAYLRATKAERDALLGRGFLEIFPDSADDLRTAGVRVLGPGGELAYIIHRVDDEQIMADLRSANAELEAFSYSVSHDLRAPLRSIDGFSQALVEDAGPGLTTEARGHLDRIRAAAQRMAQLIDDLLMLSRVSRAEMHREQVDLTDLAASIVNDLRARSPARVVDVVIAPDMTVQGDARLLRIALENLLDNAWKFTARCDDARIEVGQTAEAAQRVFYVRDNGAGFDPTYASRLFGPFQRLHAASEFPGNGIGLATVRRIVHRHGGHAWAEGAPGRGACVYFTLA
jgi:signal transduction histidine kinase